MVHVWTWRQIWQKTHVVFHWLWSGAGTRQTQWCLCLGIAVFHWGIKRLYRVSEIKNLCPAERLLYSPYNVNPADLLTWGFWCLDLVHSKLSLAGPDMLQNVNVVPISGPLSPGPFLTSESSNVTCGSYNVTCWGSSVTGESSSVIGESFNVSLLTSQQVDKLLHVDKWGNLSKAIQVVDWVLYFITNSRFPQRLHGVLMFDELTKATFKLILCVQRYEFVEEIRTLSCDILYLSHHHWQRLPHLLTVMGWFGSQVVCSFRRCHVLRSTPSFFLRVIRMFSGFTLFYEVYLQYEK